MQLNCKVIKNGNPPFSTATPPPPFQGYPSFLANFLVPPLSKWLNFWGVQLCVALLSITYFFRKLNESNLQKTWKIGSFVGLNASWFSRWWPLFIHITSNYQTHVVLLILHLKLILQWSEHFLWIVSLMNYLLPLKKHFLY